MPNPKSITTIGRRYIPVKVLGQGSMGIVYQALDRLNGTRVALKCVPLKTEDGSGLPQSTDDSATVADLALALAKEFRLLATLHHPNIINVLDYGFDNNQPFLVMNLLENATSLTNSAIPLNEQMIVNMLLQLLQALDYLHWRGMAHRDLKPNNVLVSQNKQVKVLDFGLATLIEKPEELSGTPAYLPPEVFMAENPEDLDQLKIDIYAVGILAIELITGSLPFSSTNIVDLVDQIINEDPDLTSTGKFAPIISRLIAKDPIDRYSSARAVMQDLSQIFGAASLPEAEIIRESFLQSAQLIGREQELSTLLGELDCALNGQGKAYLVSGESGVGKSRLVEELAIHALSAGALVLRGQAVSEGGTSYQLWRLLLRHLCIAVDMTELDARVVKVLVPDIGHLLDRPVPDAPLVDPKTAQERLLETIENLFRRYTSPVMVLLEDLQWADEESLTVLSRLLRVVPNQRMFMIGTYRSDEPLDLVSRFPNVGYMALSRLSKAGITQLSETILGKPGKQNHIIAWLQQETEGNVFFLIEILRALAATAGQLDAIGEIELPEHISTLNMEGIVQRRLGHVRDEYRPLLEAAAIAGRQIDVSVIQELVHGFDLQHWLYECQGASVLEIHEGEWRFAHDKLREELLRGVSAERRIELHCNIAQAIAKIYGERQAATLAYHWGMAEDKQKEVYYCGLAGERAIQSGASQEARRLLARALEVDASLCNGIPDSAHRLRWARWERGMGEAFLWLGNLTDSHHHIGKTLMLLGFPEPQKKGWLVARIARAVLVQIFHRVVLRYWSGKRHRDKPRLEEAAGAYGRAAEIHYYTGNNSQMLLAVFSALNLAESSGANSLSLVVAYGSISVVTGYLYLHRLTRYYLRKAMETASKLSDPFALSQALTRNAMYSIGQGEWDATNNFCQQALEIEERIGAERYWRETTALTSVAFYWQGRYGDNVILLRQLNLKAQQAEDFHYLAVALMWQVPSLLVLGRLDEALHHLNDAQDLLKEHPEVTTSVGIITMKASMLAWAYLFKGDLENASIHAIESTQLLLTRPNAAYGILMSLNACLDSVLTLLELEGNSEYQVLIPKLLIELHKYSRRFAVGFPCYERFSGKVIWRSGNSTLAIKRWMRGIKLATRLNMPAELGLLHLEIGRHLPKNDINRMHHLNEAQKVFKKIGAQCYLDQVHAALQD